MEQLNSSVIKDLSDLPKCIKMNEDITVTVDSFDEDSFICLFQSFTEWTSLSETNKELEAIFHNSHDGILVADGQGNTVKVSPATQRHFGVSAKEFIGKNAVDLEKNGIFQPSVILKVLEKKESVTIFQETRLGTVLLTTGNPIFDEEGQIIRVICNSRDVTELTKLRVRLKENEEKVQRYESELLKLRKKETAIEGFIAHSQTMMEVISLMKRVSGFDSNVLVTGESGTGKEVIAKAIHSLSLRNNGSFIKVNCGAIPETLLESELFGYDAGAFTGAKKGGKPGYFELADKGTLLLDEIGELPLSLQAKLLQAIQDKAIQRVGGTQTIPVDFRLIAATNRNLRDMVRDNKFREDLYYRLNVIHIQVPSLRERIVDIPFLAQYFLDKFNVQYNLQKTLDPKTVSLLCSYEWPGNVRQLQNAVERLIVLTSEEVIGIRDVYAELSSVFGTNSSSVVSLQDDFDMDAADTKEDGGDAVVLNSRIQRWENDKECNLQNILKEVEKYYIKKALVTHKTTRKAATYLNMSQPTLVRRLKDLQM
jgi:PAS domain S-box-containing protein